MARRQAPGTNQRILVVAARLFGRHGVRSVGMNQLVDETLLITEAIVTAHPDVLRVRPVNATTVLG